MEKMQDFRRKYAGANVPELNGKGVRSEQKMLKLVPKMLKR